jgi:molecular chaperone GrpE
MKNDTNNIKEEEVKEVDEKTQQEEETNEHEECEQKLEEAELKYKRALADYQNLQKRVNEDRINWIRSANQDLLLRLLPVLDTLLMASKHSKDASLQVSLGQFLDILKSEGVVRIETVGKSFDPNHMEAIETVEGEDGKVVEEVRAGFLLYDKLLRAAQVKVGKKS